MDEGRYAEACPKLGRSQSLDPQVGTMLNLAYCYENLGKTASGWSMWLEAAAAAEAKGQDKREEFARRRAAQLESRLLRVTITVAPQRDIESIDVQLDGASVPRGRWGAPTPVDPGQHWVQASGAGRRPWWARIDVDDQHMPMVEVPVLEGIGLQAGPAAGGPQIAPAGWPWQRTVAVAMGGAGVVAIAVAAVLAASAKSTYDQSGQYCGTLVCNPPGDELRSRAINEINAAGLTAAIGGGAVAGGLILWFATPTRQGGLRLAPSVGQRSWALALHGGW
jgi:serine/threonine-protein kinase